MVIIKQKNMKLIPTAVYILLWGGIFVIRKVPNIPPIAFNFAILNVVFSYWGMEFKGCKFYIEYLVLFVIYISFMGLGSACMVLYKGSLPLSQLEFWLVTFLVSTILFLFHISSINLKSVDGAICMKKCIVDPYVLLITFVLQIYLLTT